MKLPLWLFMLWPFHHKKPPIADGGIYWTDTYDPPDVKIKDSDCYRSADGWFFLGPDGAVGFSKEDCRSALHEWLGDYIFRPDNSKRI